MWAILEACSCFVCMNDYLIRFDLAGVYGKRNFMDDGQGWMDAWLFWGDGWWMSEIPLGLVC
jgi:hypothetical protein